MGGALGCANSGGNNAGFGSGSTSSGSSGGSGSGDDATSGTGSSGTIPPSNEGGLGTLNNPETGGGPSCPSTCAQLNANCGMVTDTICGGVVDCKGCAAGLLCGAVMPNQCGTGTASPDSCTPQTCASQGFECGMASDLCNHTIDCGNPCQYPQTCGGSQPNKCGCTGVCSQIPTCAEGGATTTLTGKVMDPGGINPLYNALVYIPNNPTDPALLTPFKDGVTCDVCGASAAGTPLVTTNTKTDGTFSLGPVPVGNNVKLVVQLGRWRRIFTVNISTSCGMNVVTGTGAGGAGGAGVPIQNGVLTMPKNKGEGDIPLTAIVTGDADALECVFWKMGIDQAEFTNPGGTGRVQLAYGSALDTTMGYAPGPNNPHWTDERGWVYTCTKTGGPCATCAGTCTRNIIGGGAIIDMNTPSETVFFQANPPTPATAPLTNYDLTVLSCQGWPFNPATQPVLNYYPQLVSYANSGGRVFASHFSFGYYETGGAANAFWGTANWGGAPGFVPDVTGKSVFVDTNPMDNPKGTAFAAWLANPPSAIVPTPAWMTMPPNAPTVSIQYAKSSSQSVIPPTQQWLYMSPPDTGPPFAPELFTFNMPIGAPSTMQCGRGLFSDFHVTPNNALLMTTMLNGTHGLVFPAECGPRSPMSSQEKVLEFLLFDLGSCVQPYRPICTPTTCTARNIQCGPAGDGCGGALDCGPCPPGQTCGGAGMPGVCGNVVTCTPTTCLAQGIQCGPAGDGCGNAIDCGPCPTGEICGFSGPGKCGRAN